MHIIICLDDDYGFAFNGRRQSSDRQLMQYIADMYPVDLFVSPQGAELFDDKESVQIARDFFGKAPKGSYCLIDANDPMPDEKWVEDIIVCWWNRCYPSDRKLNKKWLDERKCMDLAVVKGSSHPNILIQRFKK